MIPQPTIHNGSSIRFINQAFVMALCFVSFNLSLPLAADEEQEFSENYQGRKGDFQKYYGDYVPEEVTPRNSRDEYAMSYFKSLSLDEPADMDKLFSDLEILFPTPEDYRQLVCKRLLTSYEIEQMITARDENKKLEIYYIRSAQERCWYLPDITVKEKCDTAFEVSVIGILSIISPPSTKAATIVASLAITVKRVLDGYIATWNNMQEDMRQAKVYADAIDYYQRILDNDYLERTKQEEQAKNKKQEQKNKKNDKKKKQDNKKKKEVLLFSY